MVWDLIACFLGVTPKWIRITCLAVFQTNKSKTSIPDIVGKRPSGNVEKAPPPQVAPCVEDFRFAVKNA